MGTMPDPLWNDPENARRYAQFARTYPMYRRTSADLVDRLALAGGARVLDLACGTGITTETVLRKLGPDGRVVAHDGSPAMQEQARRHVDDVRVDWVLGAAEDIGDLVSGPFDAVVCNSAIWQTDLTRTVPAIACLLRPGGRFACNVGDYDGAAKQKPGLHDLLMAYAVIDHDFVPRWGHRIGLPVADIEATLQDNGLQTTRESVAYPADPEQEYAWLQVPIFTGRFRGLTYEQRMSALDKAWARFDRSHAEPNRWIILTGLRA